MKAHSIQPSETTLMCLTKNKNASLLFGLLLCLAGGFSSASAQGITNPGENTDLYRVNPGAPWQAESLYLGATFLRDTTKTPFRVWLDFNDA
jgi:hypothetical protein